MGFTQVARHKSKKAFLWRQGNINIILNYQPESYASYFFNEHGPSACAMGFRTRDAAKAFNKALELGAEPMYSKIGPMELNIPAIKGIGGMPIFWSIVTFMKMILNLSMVSRQILSARV